MAQETLRTTQEPGVRLERCGHAAVAVVESGDQGLTNSIYVIGGRRGRTFYNDLLRLRVEAGHWEQVYTQLPFRPRANHAAVLCGADIWVFGGSDNDSIMEDVHVLNIHTLEWRQPQLGGEPSLLARVAAGADLHPSDPASILVFGGYGRLTPSSQVYEHFNDLVRIDTRRMVVEVVAAGGMAPLPRCFHTFTTVGKCCVVLGGRRYEEGPMRGAAMVGVYDPAVGAWLPAEVAGSPPEPRSSHKAVALGGDRLVVVGGVLGKAQPSATNATGTTTPPGSRGQHNQQQHFMAVLAVGRPRSSNASPAKRTVQLSWVPCPQPTLTGRGGHGCCVVGNRIILTSGYTDQERKKYLTEAIALDAASIPAAPAANKGAASPLLLPADASSPAVLRTGGGLASVLGVHRAESLSPVLQDGALGTTPPDGRGQTGTGPGAGAGTGHLKRSAAAAAAAVAVIAAVRTPTHHQQQNQHQQQQAEVGYITSASATHVDYRDRGPSTAGTVPAAAVQAGPAASPCPSTTSPPWQVTKRPRLGSHTGTTAPATAAATHPHTPGSKAAAAGGRITGAAAGAKTPPRSPSPRDEVQAGGKSAPASPGRQRKGAGAAGGGSRSQSESQMLGEMLVKQYESRVTALEGQVATLQQAVNTAHQQCLEQSQAVRVAEARAAAEAARVAQLESELASRNAQALTLQRQVADAERRIADADRRIAELEQGSASLKQQLEGVSGQYRGLLKERDGLVQERSEAQQQYTLLLGRFREAQAEVGRERSRAEEEAASAARAAAEHGRAAAEALRALQARHEEYEKLMAAHTAFVEDHRRTVAELQGVRLEVQTTAAREAATKDSLERQVAEVTKERDAARAEAAVAQQRASGLQADVAKLQADNASLAQQLEAVRQEAARERAALQARCEALAGGGQDVMQRVMTAMEALTQASERGRVFADPQGLQAQQQLQQQQQQALAGRAAAQQQQQHHQQSMLTTPHQHPGGGLGMGTGSGPGGNGSTHGQGMPGQGLPMHLGLGGPSYVA